MPGGGTNAFLALCAENRGRQHFREAKIAQAGGGFNVPG